MDSAEAAATCHVAARIVNEVTGAVEGVHRGILSRVRSMMPLNPGAGAVLDCTELTTRAIYATVKASTTAAGYAAAAATGAIAEAGPSAADSPRGALWLAGLCAAVGDQVAAEPRTRALAPHMCFRRDGRAIDPVGAVAGASPDSKGLVVFLHGLGGTEWQWSRQFHACLDELGYHAAFVRYNTGLAIHENGAEFAELIAAAVNEFSGRGRVILVGHSMGGLVMRSALHQASGEPWVRAVSDLITLASPHRGAPLEKVSHAALSALELFRETKPLAEFGHQRAVGIKDLRFGALLPEHWGGRDPNTVLCDPTTDVPLPQHVRHHAVIALLGAPGSMKAAIFGDGMVRARSAAGRGDPPERVAVHRLNFTGHMTLLRDPHVVSDPFHRGSRLSGGRLPPQPVRFCDASAASGSASGREPW